MTQIDRIRSFIQSVGSSNIFTINDIQTDTKFPRASIRRILSGLSQKDEISRLEPGIFTPNQFRRKFIGTQKYKGNSRQFFALTYESNDIDRESELLQTLDGFLNDEYVKSASNTGYSDDIIESNEVQTEFIFPNVQVGEL